MRETPSTVPSPELHQQVAILGQMADQIRDTLRGVTTRIPPAIIESMTQLAGSLNRLSRQVDLREEERKNLMALADIGQVVNSSLDLNDVLRIVMDTIVRLSGAERGFLMLRDDLNAPLTIRIARNWEQESINTSE